MIPRSGLRVRPRGRCCQRSDHSVQPPSQQPRLTWGGGERPKGAAEPRLYTHLHSGRATAAVAATAAAARGAPEWGPWLSSPRDSEQVAAALAQGRSSARLESRRRSGRPGDSRELRSRVPAVAPACRRSGLGRGAKSEERRWLRSGRCLRCCGPARAAATTPAPSRPRWPPPPPPGARPQSQRGRAGRRLGGRWAANNKQRRKLRPGARRAGEQGLAAPASACVSVWCACVYTRARPCVSL